jgi:ABC-2 type transport system permease protein
MTTATATQRPVHSELAGARLSFPRLVRSEWIKLRSIRSTIWCFGILFLLNIGFPLLIASVGSFGDGAGGNVPADAAGSIAIQVVTLAINFTSLIVAVLGVLTITGEYQTGMIRGTFTANPGRLGSLLAKALVVAVTTFVVSAASTWIAALVVHPILAGKGVDFDLGSSSVVLPLLGSSVYVTLVALFAFAIGVIVRATAGGVAITIGVLLVAFIVLTIIGQLVDAHWPENINAFLPSQAGGQLFAYDLGSSSAPAEKGVVSLNGWQGFGVLGAEVLAVGIAALVLVKRRDA